MNNILNKKIMKTFQKLSGELIYSPMINKPLAVEAPYNLGDFLCYASDNEYMILKRDFDPLEKPILVLQEGEYEDEEDLQSIMTMFKINNY